MGSFWISQRTVYRKLVAKIKNKDRIVIVANKFKKNVRRIVNAIQRNEVRRERLISHIDRIILTVSILDEKAMLDLEIKIDDSNKLLAKMEESDEKKIALYQLKNYRALIDFHKKIKEKV